MCKSFVNLYRAIIMSINLIMGSMALLLIVIIIIQDGCFTSDSDVFLFGARTVYRDICLGD